jgi:nitroreductase
MIGPLYGLEFPMNLELSADELLTTTRAVRKRLDLNRPVERSLLLECTDIAFQAPTGSNAQGWHFLFVEDPEKKRQLADLYGQGFDPYVNSPPREYAPGDIRAQRAEFVRGSAMHLREVFHEVPVLLIPLMLGRPEEADSFGQASMWGSIIPAVWSFMLAARERGIGSAWTTLHLPFEREAAELLGIDYNLWTQVGLFPVAHTIGTDFQRAPRLDTAGLVSFDTFGSQ